MGIDCLKCINSACCSLTIRVDRREYQKFPKSIKDAFLTNTKKFLNENPKYLKREACLDEMYKDDFAVMNKESDGLCVLLDRDTMKCSEYDDRPDVCKAYKTNRCEKIRLMKDE